MQGVDVGSIVPSTRDLLQALGTRRRNLALAGVIPASEEAGHDGGPPRTPAREAGRLYDLNVSAFAFLEPGPAMTAAARATKTVPSLCLAPAETREAIQLARQHGADGVCIDATLPVDDWDRLAKIARSMRMAPLALATDAAGLEAAGKAGAKAVVLRSGSAADLIAAAATAPRSMTVIGLVDGADPDAIRALAGKVDAAVVPAAVHTSAGFAALVAEVDP